MGPLFRKHLDTVPHHLLSVVSAYGQNVCAFGEKIDPSGDLDWFAMWVGFALARGVKDEDALNYRVYDQYVYPMETMHPAEILGPLTPEYAEYLKSPLDPRD